MSIEGSGGLGWTKRSEGSPGVSSCRSPTPAMRQSLECRAHVIAVVGLMCALSAASPAQEPSSILPFTTTDHVVIRDGNSERSRTVPGVIEDLSGNSLVFRRGGNTVEVLKLRDIEFIRFSRSAAFDEGLRRMQNHEWPLAIGSLKIAETTEPREWVVREIQASLAESLRAVGQFEECLEVVERIYEKDPNTRHLNMLPLVWDERLPEQHRCKARPEDLKAASLLRQLVAASALLQDSEHETAATVVLQSLKNGPRAALQQLAEAQLWRLRLLHPENIRASEIEHWMQRVREFDKRQRSGPEFVIGRALLTIHDYDNASTSLLWMPLVAPLDPPTTTACTMEAITALTQSGRLAEAAQLRQTLKLPKDAAP